MARIRTIKPEFFTSETVSTLPIRARLTFIGLWTHCDDHGRCKAHPKLIKAAVWPLDDVSIQDIETDLMELETAGLIVGYVSDGREYLAIPSWDEHQAASYRRGEAKYPPPPGDTTSCTSSRASRTTERASRTTSRAGTGNREQGTLAPDDKETAPAPRSEMWDALASELGEVTTKSARSLRGKIVAELIEAGATPDDVKARVRAYRAKWPKIDITDAALAKHWDSLDGPNQAHLPYVTTNTGIRLSRSAAS